MTSNIDTIIETVRATKKPYVNTFKYKSTRIEVFEQRFLTTQSFLLPDFEIVPLEVTEANFYVSQWKFEIKLKNKIQNKSFRNIRRGNNIQSISFENIYIGNYSSGLPFTRRHSYNYFTLTASKQGLGSGAFKDLVQAFLTGTVSGEFKINAKGCAFLLCTEKQFHIRGIFPVKKVNVSW